MRKVKKRWKYKDCLFRDLHDGHNDDDDDDGDNNTDDDAHLRLRWTQKMREGA